MKDVIYETLKTPYFDTLDRESPWDVYPRPQLVRDSFFSLNGSWDFKVTESADIPAQFSEKILVPFPPESLLSGIERRMPKDAYLAYRRYFTLPEGFVKDRVILHFGAVDQRCKVYVNGKQTNKYTVKDGKVTVVVPLKSVSIELK